MTELRQRPGDQPLPTPNQNPAIADIVIADIQQRRALGVQRYGTPLQPHNGRDALRDLYEELLDAAHYIRQAIFEREQPAAPVEIGSFAELCDVIEKSGYTFVGELRPRAAEQQPEPEAVCPCGCPVEGDMCACPEQCPCDPDCGYCESPYSPQEARAHFMAKRKLLTAVGAVLWEHIGVLSGPWVDANLAELAHVWLAAGPDDPHTEAEVLARLNEGSEQ